MVYKPEYGIWWNDELDYLDTLITMDSRNNSAWNQRWFVIHNRNYLGDHSGNRSLNVPKEILMMELNYVKKSINKIKLNESSWNYLRGLWNLHKEFEDLQMAVSEMFVF